MIRIFNLETKEFLDDPVALMNAALMDSRMEFEAVGIQDDYTPVVFDKCGNFGYLDPNVYGIAVFFNQLGESH
jgi:hypothetical protein